MHNEVGSPLLQQTRHLMSEGLMHNILPQVRNASPSTCDGDRILSPCCEYDCYEEVWGTSVTAARAGGLPVVGSCLTSLLYRCTTKAEMCCDRGSLLAPKLRVMAPEGRG